MTLPLALVIWLVVITVYVVGAWVSYPRRKRQAERAAGRPQLSVAELDRARRQRAGRGARG